MNLNHNINQQTQISSTITKMLSSKNNKMLSTSNAATPTSNTNRYIPPNKKQTNTLQNTASASTSTSTSASASTFMSASLKLTKKSEPQKVFSLATTEFPSLATNTARHVQPNMSFANAAKTVINSAAPNTTLSTNEVPPGWIHIRKRNGRIEYKEGPPSNRYPVYDDNDDYLINEWLFKHRVAKEQYKRDIDVLCRGDLSEYYGLPTVYEQYLEDFAKENQKSNTPYSSDSSDNEYVVADNKQMSLKKHSLF